MEIIYATDNDHDLWCNYTHDVSNLECQIYLYPGYLTHKQLESHGCLISTVATDALGPKHQAISIHSADLVSIVLPKIRTKMLHLLQTT